MVKSGRGSLWRGTKEDGLKFEVSTYATLDEKISTLFAFVTRPSAMAKSEHKPIAKPSRTLSDWI